MNIYLHELKGSLRSVLIWSASLTALIMLFMSIFPSFSADSALLEEMMSKFPQELLIAFGLTDMDFSTVLGYFGLIFTFGQICLAIQAANYGFGLVSVEETEWTADFLLSRPVSRPRIMTAKLLAALSGLAITDVILVVASFIFTAMFAEGEEVPTRPLTLLLLSVPVFQLFFLTTGMMISLLVKRIRSVAPFSMGWVFALYILNAFGGMIGETSLEVLSPFKHFAPSYIIRNSAWDTPLAIANGAVILGSIVAAYLLYARRNIASAV